MDILSPDLPRIFFKKLTKIDRDEITMDRDMIRLLMAINEEKNMSQVAREAGMNMPTLRETLSRLMKLGLIEPVEKEVAFLDKKFLDTLKIKLSKAVGPMADFLIEDVVSEMEVSVSEIPVYRAAEVISSLAREIPEEGNRIQFQKSMIEMIPKIKT